MWYFTPYYSILRAVPPLFGSQFPGVIAMGLSVMIFFALPWLDRGAVKSIRYRGTLWQRSYFAMFLVCFVVLGYLGVNSTDVWGRFGDWSNFLDTKGSRDVGSACVHGGLLWFFFLMPWYTRPTRPSRYRLASQSH